MSLKLCLVAGSLCAASMCLAATSANAACLRGRSKTNSGAVVANASIAVKASGTFSREVRGNSAGEFEICGLEPGKYEITAQHDGFAEEVRWATVADEDESLDIQLAQTDLHSGTPHPVQASSEPDVSGADETAHPTSVAGEFQYHAAPSPPATIPDAPGFDRDHAPHGQAYGFWGSGLAGRGDVPVPTQFPLSQLGASIGGDIGSGRTSYFFAFDQFGMDPQRLASALAAVEAHSRPLPANTNVLTFSSLDARIDHRFSARDSMYTRVNAGDARSSLAGRGADGSPKLVNTRHLSQISATAANTADLSPDTVNETRVQFTAGEISLPAGSPEVGVQSGLPTVRRDRVLEAANNVYRQVGGQSLRFGGDFLFNEMSVSFLESAMGRAGSGDSSFSQSSRGAGLYIASQRQVRPNLLLTSGVRYEIQPLKGFKTDTNNLAPQVGFAWSPSSRTVIRGGAIYYDQLPLPMLPASTRPGSPTDIQDAAHFASRSGGTAGQMADFTLVSPLIQNSYVETANFGIEQRLSAHTWVSSDYQFGRGVQLAMPVFRPALLCATPAACHSGNTFRGAEEGTGAESSYQGLSVSFTQDPVRWGNYRVTYTRSTEEGSGTEGNGSYISDDLRRVSFTGVLHTSGDPASNWRQRFSHGYVLSGSGDYSSRTEFIGMNFIDMNARLTKTLAWGQRFRFDALAETFNSLERTNAAFQKSFANAGESAGSIFSVYRSIASLQGPTGAQFGLRLEF